MNVEQAINQIERLDWFVHSIRRYNVGGFRHHRHGRAGFESEYGVMCFDRFRSQADPEGRITTRAATIPEALILAASMVRSLSLERDPSIAVAPDAPEEDGR